MHQQLILGSTSCLFREPFNNMVDIIALGIGTKEKGDSFIYSGKSYVAIF